MEYAKRNELQSLSPEMRRAEKISFAEMLKKRSSKAEITLWTQLRTLAGNWERQKVLLGYILDFWSEVFRVCVEVDGTSHRPTGKNDKLRDERLLSNGICTIRLSDEEIALSGRSAALKVLSFCELAQPERVALTQSISYPEEKTHGRYGLKVHGVRPGSTGLTRTLCGAYEVNVDIAPDNFIRPWTVTPDAITCAACKTKVR